MSGINSKGYLILFLLVLPVLLGVVGSIVMLGLELFGVIDVGFWCGAPLLSAPVIMGVIYLVLALKNG